MTEISKTRDRLQATSGSKQMSLLPEPNFKPKLPPKGTLAHRALLMMLQGRKISHPHFQDKTSSWRLAAHVYILKKLGWPIEAIEIPFRIENKPKGCRICRYFLSPDVIQKLGVITKEVLHV